MKKKGFMSIANSFLLTGLVFFISSCETSKKEDGISKDSMQNEKLVKLDVSLLTHDTLIVNKEQLIKILKDNKFISLLTIKGDTIVKFNDYYSNIKFLDIDQDGYIDIRVYVNSNTPNECINYFFDKQSNGYKEIINSTLDVERIKGTNLFYSYNATGCGDMNWESHISKIENWQETNIGSLEVKGCGNKDSKITIYKINKMKKEIIDSKPLTVLEKRDKWDFISEYWKRNYTLFL